MDYEKIKRVYVAGKLNSNAIEYLNNVHKMLESAEEVRLLGFAPYIPALDLLMGIKFGYNTYEDYFDSSQAWLLASDAVFLTPGWETSKGTGLEVALAEEHGIPVFENIEDLQTYFEVFPNGDKTEI